MAPKRATRSNTAPETTNTTSVTLIFGGGWPLTSGNGLTKAVADAFGSTINISDADRNTNGDDSHNSGMGVRRTERTAHEFENQVKFATCTLHSVALTWWNTHVKTVGHDAAYGMPWKTLMKMMTDKYCPRNEIKKLEMEIWDLKRVKGSLRTPQGTLRTNNNNNNRTRGRTLAGLILQGLVKRNNMGDLNPYAQNATITMTVHVLPDATSAIKSAIWPLTAGALQPLTMLTIRGALGQVRSLLAMSVEFRDILRGNV
ncbi:reverse transcriptase domain-containing protein [Tanacetum coccineum]